MMQGIELWLLKWCAQVEFTLHAADRSFLVTRHQTDHRSAGSGPGGATRSMEVVLVVARRVEVDHRLNRVDVDAPRRHIRGDQRLGTPGREGMQGSLPLVLGSPAVHGDRTHSQLGELLGKPVGAVAGAGEDD